MASAKPKSKKRSASNNAPPERPTLFIDRSAWSRALGEALTENNIPFVAHDRLFPQNCPDEEWLRKVGGKHWLVITRDDNIRRKANEQKAFRDAGLIVFVLASGNAKAVDQAALLVELYPRLAQIAGDTKPPAIFSVTLKRTVSRLRD